MHFLHTESITWFMSLFSHPATSLSMESGTMHWKRQSNDKTKDFTHLADNALVNIRCTQSYMLYTLLYASSRVCAITSDFTAAPEDSYGNPRCGSFTKCHPPV